MNNNNVSKIIQNAVVIAFIAAHDIQIKLNNISKLIAIKEKSSTLTNQLINYPLVSIIMTYFNRKTQTKLTFDNFEKMYANKYNIEVIIVDDSSRESEKLQKMIHNYSFKIKLVELKEKHWINPVVPSNIAITHIDPNTELVIIQNPEILHSGDVIGDALNVVTPENYITYPTFNSPHFKYNKQLRKLFDKGKTNFYLHFVKKIN